MGSGATAACNAGSEALVRAYLLAKQRVIESGFESEIAWQESVSIDDVTPRVFMREAAWVVLCAGMRESVIRARFDSLGRVFGSWDPVYIIECRTSCHRKARDLFNHEQKLLAIEQIAVSVVEDGIDQLVHGLQREGPTYLMRLPYIGRVTCFHLAKNLGYPVAKPDRHLQRMAAALEYEDASSLCWSIANALDEPVQVVDIVMWRFATLERGYESWLRKAAQVALRRPQDVSFAVPERGVLL